MYRPAIGFAQNGRIERNQYKDKVAAKEEYGSSKCLSICGVITGTLVFINLGIVYHWYW